MTQPNPSPGDPAPSPTAPPAPAPPGDPAPQPAPAPEDKPLGPGGEKALQAEREARKELERKLKALEPLEKLAATLGGQPTGDGRTDLERLTERLDGYEQQIASERAARWGAEVAAEKQLTPQQAERLRGSTREELLADADQLLALFPAPAGPRTPAPDPSQGARGTAPPDIDAQIRDAQAKGDWRTVISLQNRKLGNIK